jgi:DNA-directed RNA polymerase specialized sigma24 family protein
LSDSPGGLNPNNPIDPTVAAIIRSKASRLVGRAGLRVQDRDDLVQQLTLHVLERQSRFDSARGTWAAFVWRLVEWHGENLIRARRAAKRDGGPLVLLSDAVPAPDEDGTAQTVHAALAALSEELRDVAVQVLTTGSVAGAARALGVSRATVTARLREIRERIEFRELGGNP